MFLQYTWIYPVPKTLKINCLTFVKIVILASLNTKCNTMQELSKMNMYLIVSEIFNSSKEWEEKK